MCVMGPHRVRRESARVMCDRDATGPSGNSRIEIGWRDQCSTLRFPVFQLFRFSVKLSLVRELSVHVIFDRGSSFALVLLHFLQSCSAPSSSVLYVSHSIYSATRIEDQSTAHASSTLPRSDPASQRRACLVQLCPHRMHMRREWRGKR